MGQSPVAESPWGAWQGSPAELLVDPLDQAAALQRVLDPLIIVHDGRSSVGYSLAKLVPHELGRSGGRSVLGVLPAVDPGRLGDATFRHDHRLKYAYVSGAMAAGIGSEAIVESMARSGMLGFFGSAGLSLARVEQAVDRLQASVGQLPHGFNLIHSPNDPRLERDLVQLYINKSVRLAEASAFLDLTPHVVRFRLHGIRLDPNGKIVTPNRLIAKVSRVEVASKFFAPPPERILAQLIEEGSLTPQQAEWARRVPVAQDVTAEADSGGHTDNRPHITLIPTLLALRDRMQAEHQFEQPLRVGAAGGISTPSSVAAAFAMGAAYVLVGSVQQACVESGTCDEVRKMLADAEQADTAMCPCADMFEMGVKVQVLKRGTMFPMRAAKLYELYRNYAGLDAIPAEDRATLEKSYFKNSLDAVWEGTRQYFVSRDPDQIAKAERDPKHKMALVFRAYLGQSSRWANTGEAGRRLDYQIWCGPAMGAFNEWTRGTFLASPSERQVETVGLNLLYGGAVMTRVNFLRSQGLAVPATSLSTPPRRLAEIRELMA